MSPISTIKTFWKGKKDTEKINFCPGVVFAGFECFKWQLKKRFFHGRRQINVLSEPVHPEII